MRSGVGMRGIGANKPHGGAGVGFRPSRSPLEGLRGPNGLSIAAVAAAAAAARSRLGLVAARSMTQGERRCKCRSRGRV